jgi:hypothetical protein
MMADELELKPENDEAQWREDFLTDGGSDESYKIGYAKGWDAAIEKLRELGHEMAADELALA